jgi:hypothetical protein
MPQPGEPLWLEDDRAWALALHQLEADPPHDCGFPLSETLDPKNETAYTVDLLGSCAACYALQARAEGLPDGMLYRVRRKATSG